MKRKTKADLLKEIEELQRRIADSAMAATGGQAEEKGRTANQQLSASEQQLKAANQQLEAHNRELARLAIVVRDSNDAVTVQDLEGNITAWNRGAERMYGWSEEDALTMNIRDTVPEEQREQALNLVEVLQRGELIESLETKRVTKDGRVLDAWLAVTKLMDDTGKMIGVVSTERDITERKRAEEAPRASEAQYRALFEGAAEGILVADLETRKFMYANPAICKMLGYTEEELLRLSVMDIHPRESLDHVLAEFEAQARGDKTLALSLPCLRKDGRVAYADVNTASVIIGDRKCNVGFFTDITGLKRAEEVELVVQESLTAEADPVLMRAVFENLLGNAWKFTGRQEKACIECGALALKDRAVYFVRDDGVGFDMTYAGKLFGAFQRLHSSAEFEGTGIGLATVQRIVHRHGGRVWAEAAVGKGATFYFTL